MLLFLPFVAAVLDDADVARRAAPIQAERQAEAPAIWLTARAGPARLQSAVVFRPPAAPFELWRAADGLFYVEGLVNSRPVRFLVDTGASMIVLTAADARRVGALPGASSGHLTADTAAGKRSMSKVTLARIEVGGTGAAVVPAAVAGEELSVSLLGQNWLSHLSSVVIEGDRMLLR